MSDSPSAGVKPRFRQTQAKRRTITDTVVEELARLIVSGVYAPGERLREQEIADRFSVSRGPVREALRILETRAIVTIQPMVGATVCRISDGEALELVQVSAALFGLAAARAAERGLTGKFDLLEAKVRLLERDAPTDLPAKRFFQETERAGMIILDAAEAPRIKRMIIDTRIGAPSLYGPLGFTTPALRQRAAQTWVRLLNALRAGDAEKSRKLAQKTHDDVLAAINRIRT